MYDDDDHGTGGVDADMDADAVAIWEQVTCFMAGVHFVIMPNGNRLLYALGVGRNGSHDTPSPLHTSDEEDVWVAKCRWRLLGRWVYKRWCLFVAKRRAHALRGCETSLVEGGGGGGLL